MEQPGQTQGRKADHIRINLEEDVRSKGVSTGFERYRLVHCALPELDLDAVDTRTAFLGRDLGAPILISSMTGGLEQAHEINRRLASAAQRYGCAMGVGSERAAVERPELARYFQVRDAAPDVLLLANLGAVQLNYGYGVDECRRAVDMIGADALVLHLNPLQEAVQPEGNTRFAGLLGKLEQVCARLGVPVIVKEVGWGLSASVATRLRDAGVSAVDIAGAGGTSWSEVERYRTADRVRQRVAAAFAGWGIPTAESLRMVREAVPELPVIASGGLRTGLDAALSVAMGASLAGFAGPLLRAAAESEEAVYETVGALVQELRIAAFCTGSADMSALARAEVMRV